MSNDLAVKTREEVLRDFRTDQILQAARRVMGEIGVEASSVDKIAEAAGVARSTVYVYFDGKQDLLNQCLAQNRVALGERVRASVTAAEPRLERGLVAFLEAIFEYVDEYRHFFRAIMKAQGLDPFFPVGDRSAPELDVIRNEALVVITEIVESAVARGEVSGRAAIRLGEQLGIVIYGALMRRAHESSPKPAREDARLLTHVLLHGALTNPLTETVKRSISD